MNTTTKRRTKKAQKQFSIWELVGRGATCVSGTYDDWDLAYQRTRELTASLSRTHVAVEIGSAYETQLKGLIYRNN